MRLTKNRLRQLDAALTVDDILHEKFVRLHHEVQREWDRIWKAKTIVQVIERDGGIYRQLEILRIEPTLEGTRVIVRGAAPRSGERKGGGGAGEGTTTATR